ncbi:MAG: hypothetical protein WAN11_27405 [Syntrophobacteraceae bacterium]
MNNRMRSLSFAATGILISALFLSQRHGPKELSGPSEKLTITISGDLHPVLVKSPWRKVFQGAG